MAERMVNSILVPVSPSGTGKTLMASIPGAFFSNQAVPETQYPSDHPYDFGNQGARQPVYQVHAHVAQKHFIIREATGAGRHANLLRTPVSPALSPAHPGNS